MLFFLASRPDRAHVSVVGGAPRGAETEVLSELLQWNLDASSDSDLESFLDRMLHALNTRGASERDRALAWCMLAYAGVALRARHLRLSGHIASAGALELRLDRMYDEQLRGAVSW